MNENSKPDANVVVNLVVFNVDVKCNDKPASAGTPKDWILRILTSGFFALVVKYGLALFFPDLII
ncbi:hypothetical protein HA050_03980 [Iodobacter sp. HSC-16F04]|uniref:Uncharacterized protein n=1 Tax=Iodobacter violaceini TaxID=3044271 RepID=A0ABX0KP20_9NEIS|nr:hypothetical protein [Iodobacter violacea]NHQ85269.1 hypothetical protein [Iodobacter violacea]